MHDEEERLPVTNYTAHSARLLLSTAATRPIQCRRFLLQLLRSRLLIMGAVVPISTLVLTITGA